MKKFLIVIAAFVSCMVAQGQNAVITVAAPDTLDFESVESFLAKNPQARIATAADGNVVVKFNKAIFYNIRESDNDTNDANSVLRQVGHFMQRFKDSRIHAVGYADRGTGNFKLNQMYAGRRASQFCDDLRRRYNIERSRITSESMGDVVQPFADNDRNRCVIVTGIGYLYVTPPAPKGPSQAELLADSLRRMQQLEKERRYAEERQKHAKEPVRKDTIYITRVDTINHVDTLWLQPLTDTLHAERPFRLNRAHRWYNWFLTFEGGPSIFQGDHNVDAPYRKCIYPTFTASLGKWLYPAIGVRATVDYDIVHSYFNPDASDWQQMVHHAAIYNERPWLYRMHYNAWNFHGDLLLNLSSFMWTPYNRRIWNLIPYVGLGCIVNWDQPWFNYGMCWDLGVINSFRVCEQLDINLDIRVKKFPDDFNKFIQGRDNEGMINFMIGATWHFTKRGF